MPTTDTTNTTRTARIRQAAISVGVSKAGNSRSSSLHMALVLGGVPIKIKNSAGLSLNNTPVDTSGNSLSLSGETIDPILSELEIFNFVKIFYSQAEADINWLLYGKEGFDGLIMPTRIIGNNPDGGNGPDALIPFVQSTLSTMTFEQWIQSTPGDRLFIYETTLRVSRGEDILPPVGPLLPVLPPEAFDFVKEFYEQKDGNIDWTLYSTDDFDGLIIPVRVIASDSDRGNGLDLIPFIESTLSMMTFEDWTRIRLEDLQFVYDVTLRVAQAMGGGGFGGGDGDL